MDEHEFSTLLEALMRVPDPRHAHGKQLEWTMILGIIAGAIVSQQGSVTAMAHWTHAQTAVLLRAFQPARGRLPSEATLRRAVQHVDIHQLEHELAHVLVPLPPSSHAVTLQGAAVDGK